MVERAREMRCCTRNGINIWTMTHSHTHTRTAYTRNCIHCGDTKRYDQPVCSVSRAMQLMQCNRLITSATFRACYKWIFHIFCHPLFQHSIYVKLLVWPQIHSFDEIASQHICGVRFAHRRSGPLNGRRALIECRHKKRLQKKQECRL